MARGGVRCAAPIGTNEIWRAIWLRWLELGRGRSSGRHFGEVVAARPPPPAPRPKACSAPCDLRCARAGLGASFKPTTQARDDADGDDMGKWLWAERTISNRRKPSDSDRDVHTKFFTSKVRKVNTLHDVIQSESFTRKPRRNELFRSAAAKPVMVYCRPPDYTARDGLHIADGAEPWCGPARRLANPCVGRTSGAPSCALFHSPVPGPGHDTRYSPNVLWRPRFS